MKEKTISKSIVCIGSDCQVPLDKDLVLRAINHLVFLSHAMAVKKGFWDHSGRNVGEVIALMHSELSEALESARHGYPESDKIPPYSNFVEEIADLLIRVFDFCGEKNMDLGGAILAKMEYNKGRPYKHGKQF